MFNKYIVLNGTEKTFIESINKKQAMEDMKAMKIDGVIYPDISANIGNVYHLAAYIVKKSCLRYSGDNKTLYNIGVNAKVYNNLLSNFIPSEDVPDIDRYSELKFNELNHDTKDAIQAIVEKIFGIEDKSIENALSNGFKAINAYIYGEKTNNEKGTYNNLIQNRNGEIITDKIPALRALAKAIRNTYTDNIDKIIAIIGTALNDESKITSEHIEILTERINGRTYKEIAIKHGVNIRYIQAKLETVQRAVKKHGNKMFPEVMNTLRKIVRVEYIDTNGERAHYNTLERI